ncbi:ATP-binding protein [Variovorax humicola]|uniref:ATP-binding protein n=1 Tax=Variovorax humicola TaxID=1769758 RepID=A0ABU8WBE6_9BURK
MRVGHRAPRRTHAAPADRLSGSGKSTVAAQLLELAGAVRLRSDVERKRLFGLSALAHSSDQALDIYTPDATRRTFARLAEAVRLALQAGCPGDHGRRLPAPCRACRVPRLAVSLQVPFAILDLRASPAQPRHRVAARHAGGLDRSEADPAVLERQFAFQEPLDA